MLSKKFATTLEKFSQYKKEYNHHKEEAEYKKRNLKINYIDTTHILPQKALAQLCKSTNSLYIKSSAIDLFLNNQNSAKAFVIQSSVQNDTIGRYKVTYKQTRFENIYSIFPSTLNYKIDKVYFNYIPQKFTAHDSSIDIEVFNAPLAGTNQEVFSASLKAKINQYDKIKELLDTASKGEIIQYIKIQNNTKEFIELDTIAGYYGEDVTDNIINIKDLKRVKIPPMSYKIFKTGYNYKYRINDFPKSKLLLVKNKNQKVPYGFSIGYKMVNQNIIKNLYKVNEYTIRNFQ
jgi:hypothetical protein